MLARRTKNPTEKEWLAQKPRLKKLWLEEGKTMAAVTKIMETEYSFTQRMQHDASARPASMDR